MVTEHHITPARVRTAERVLEHRDAGASDDQYSLVTRWFEARAGRATFDEVIALLQRDGASPWAATAVVWGWVWRGYLRLDLARDVDGRSPVEWWVDAIARSYADERSPGRTRRRAGARAGAGGE